MKALSIQQPWAWAILHGGKDVENRTWTTNFRGEIAIHAPATRQTQPRWPRWPRGAPIPVPEELHLSAIVGTAELADVVRKSPSPWYLGPFGFVLRNPRPLAHPVPCKGGLMLWSVPPAVLAAVRVQQGVGRHFIAYHNADKMGHALHEGDALRLLTNKPVKHLLHHTVWFVTSASRAGRGARQYALGSVFRVAEIGSAAAEGFQRFATGSGHVFRPPPPLQNKEWLRKVLRATGHFAFGVQEIKDETVIAELTRLAEQDGYGVA